MNLAEQLAQGSAALDLALDEPTQRRLLAYVDLIHKWNQVHNLTAIRDRIQMVSHHLLDSLAVARHLAPGTLADVGSGAGLPGIPLALADPQRPVALIESNQKKAAFLRQCKAELQLSNVEIVHERVEKMASREYDVVISRAFADLAEFVSLASGICKGGGALAAMKGVYPHEELAQLPDSVALMRVIALEVPGVAAARHLVLLRRNVADVALPAREAV